MNSRNPNQSGIDEGNTVAKTKALLTTGGTNAGNNAIDARDEIKLNLHLNETDFGSYDPLGLNVPVGNSRNLSAFGPYADGYRYQSGAESIVRSELSNTVSAENWYGGDDGVKIDLLNSSTKKLIAASQDPKNSMPEQLLYLASAFTVGLFSPVEDIGNSIANAPNRLYTAPQKMMLGFENNDTNLFSAGLMDFGTGVLDLAGVGAVVPKGKAFSLLRSDATNSARADFASEAKLMEHFDKHGGEFRVTSAQDYLNVGQDIMEFGHKFEYLYKGETRTGFAQFMGNSAKGNAKFGFVGTNSEGSITTIHVKRAEEFWKLINGNKLDNTIRVVP